MSAAWPDLSTVAPIDRTEYLRRLDDIQQQRLSADERAMARLHAIWSLHLFEKAQEEQ